MRSLLGALSLILLGSLGCSHNSPNAPQLTSPAPSGARNTVGLGAWDLAIDPSALTVDLLEARTGATLGDDLLLDASPYFHAALRIATVDRLANGQLAITVGIRHPLPLPDPAHPKPSDRLDLHVADVLGVLVLDGSDGLDAFDEHLVPGVLTNAAGYTGALNPSLTAGFATTSTVHPYVVLSLDTRTPNFDPASPNGWTDLRNPEGYNVLPMGGAEKLSTLNLNLTPGTHRVRLAVQATAQVSGVAPASRMNPVYAYPEGNQKAAWAMVPSLVNDALGPGDTASSTTVRLDVYDWQQAATVEGAGWNATQHKGLVRAASTITDVEVVVPAWGLYGADGLTTPISGTGQPGSPARLEATLINTTGAGTGTAWAVARVKDSTTPVTVLGRDGQPLPIVQSATYAVIPITIPPRPAIYPARIRCATPYQAVYLDDGETRGLPVTVVNSDGSTEPWTGPVTYSLVRNSDPTVMSLAADGTITRLAPRDQYAHAIVRAAIEMPEGPFVTDTTVIMATPWPGLVSEYLPGCGASGVGADPALVLGGPRGAGENGGSTHTTSLGYGGSLTLDFQAAGILDRPGDDFIVFENAFNIGQDPTQRFTETARVEVFGEYPNGDQAWIPFPMDYRAVGSTPWRNPENFSGLAGVHPVLANVDENAIDPRDPAVAGGDAFDLADIGVAYTRMIRLTSTGIDASSPCFGGCGFDNRLRDKDGELIDDNGKHETCSGIVGGPDIDAVAIVRGHQGVQP